MAKLYISAGSNRGDCIEHLRAAAQLLPPAVRILRTSPLYLTEPWGYKEQASFYNLIWEAETQLSPEALLRYLKRIERRIGREKTFRYGPRVIDLDIALYDDRIYHSATLDIPHLQLPNRRFVLQPLCDLIPNGRDPRSGKTFSELLDACPPDDVQKLDTPLEARKIVFREGLRPYVMGIINLTPDSFSGDGILGTAEVLRKCEQHLSEGADILDLGAESTRPGALPVSSNEELNRLLPLLRAVRKEFPDAALSVDSGKGDVIRAAVENGIDWINCTGNTLDRELIRCCAESGKPTVLMRSAPIIGDTIASVSAQCADVVSLALEEGVDPRNIILDPGIGFGSDEIRDMEILRGLDAVKKQGFPILVGPSRKSFIGKWLNAPVNEREAGTIASICFSILKGADIIRVHNVKFAKEALSWTDLLRDE